LRRRFKAIPEQTWEANQVFSIRIWRGLSWLERSESAPDIEGQFISLWTAFNAIYGRLQDDGMTVCPEWSPREIACHIADQGRFTVSESTVSRILKKAGWIKPLKVRTFTAGSEYHTKTRRPNQQWQSGALDAYASQSLGRGEDKPEPLIEKLFESYDRNPWGTAWGL